MKRIYLFLASILVLSLWAGCTGTMSVEAQSSGYSLRFRGHGTGDIDRVKIKIDAPAMPADVGGNFTIEFWLKAALSENTSSACTPGSDHWINGNTIIDRDIFGDGDYGDYGISLANGRIAFGVARGTAKNTICGATNVANGKWHHIAVTRSSATGMMKIFLDGRLDRSGTGPTGNISYHNDRTTPYPNSDPYLVVGAEKHDAGSGFPSFSGYLDEVRISKSIRYSSNFTKPSAPFSADPYTAALYHFDEGPAGMCAGTILDSSTTGTSDGECKFGGTVPGGPAYTTIVPFASIPNPVPGGGPKLSGCPLYPADNIWNARVDSLPVHARSSAWIDSVGRTTNFHMDFGSGIWAGGPIGIPFNQVTGSTVQKYTFDFYYPTESDAGPYPIPASPVIEYGSDHHLIVLDKERCKLYEIYDASFSGVQWYGGSGAIWDLNSHALRIAGWTSADAAGLPILPGLVRYDEVASGIINHALRFTISNTNSYIWPARHLTSGTPGIVTDAPPMGARFRLKASFNIAGFDPKMRVILQAMKTYGVIVADNGSDWYLSGGPDERWNNDLLHTLDVLTGNDFEAVDVSSLMINSNSGQAKTPLTSWRPLVGDTIQIQYSGTLNLTYRADIYNLDMFDTTIAQVAGLHTRGRKVMCYINAGAWEDWRPDASQYPAIVLGNNYAGWPGERWVDIRRIDLLAPILRARLDLCKSKGFDGVDPDNINGYLNPTGFPLSAQDQLNFNIWLANEAHARGLSIGLKNDSEQLSNLLAYFDWGLTEDCFDQGWCADLSPFITAGKPVFAVEYTDTGIDFDQFCQQATSLGLTGILKNRGLDAYIQTCP